MPCWASGQLDGLLFSAWFSEVSHHVKSVVIWTLQALSSTGCGKLDHVSTYLFLAAKIFSYHVSSPRNPIFDHSEWLVHACLGSIRKDHWGEWSEGQRHARQTVPLPSCQSSCHRSHFKIFTRKKSTIVLKPKHTSDPAPHGFKTLAWKDFSNCCQFPHRETGSWMCCAAATFQI
jgi:hypothetical protein